MELIKKYKKPFICILSIIIGILFGLIVYRWTDYYLIRLLTPVIVIVLSLVIVIKNITKPTKSN